MAFAPPKSIAKNAGSFGARSEGLHGAAVEFRRIVLASGPPTGADRAVGGTKGKLEPTGPKARTEAREDARPRTIAAALEMKAIPQEGEVGEPGTDPARAAEDRGSDKKRGASVSDDVMSAMLSLGKSSAVDANLPRAKRSLPGTEAVSSIGEKASRPPAVPTVTLLDLRHPAKSQRDSANLDGPARREALRENALRDSSAREVSSKTDAVPKDVKKEAKTAGFEAGREAYHELFLDARGSGDSGGFSIAPKAEAGAGRAQDFQAMMAERMREAWNGEIVQSAHIVLKDGDAGTIRLRLKPETLGNVKIELNLSENNISGRIVVESDEAKSAFERNMKGLADAFKQGGFESAKLEVSVGGGSGGGASAGGAQGGYSGGPFFSERLRNVVSSAADPISVVTTYARRGGAVDILA